MSKEYIRNCAWGFSCDAKWEKLSETPENKVRFCETCQREVHRCDDEGEIASNIVLNRSVSFSSNAVDTISQNDFGWGKPKQQQQGGWGQPQKPAKNTTYNEPPLDFDDDIPF